MMTMTKRQSAASGGARFVRLCGGLLMVALAGPGYAEVVYKYEGQKFDTFSTPSSYTTNDRVTATLTLSQPLPPNLHLEDIRNYPGFGLTMSDGHQTLQLLPNTSGEALVSTDVNGQITVPRSFFINCCLNPNNGIATIVYPELRGMFDQGTLSAPNGSFPDLPRDQGSVFSLVGIWTPALHTSRVSWGVYGTITEVHDDVPAPFAGIQVGDKFEVEVTFDTDATLFGTLSFPPGELHYYDPSSIVMTVRIGALDPVTIPWTGPGSGNPFYGNALYVRDASGDQAPQGEPVAQDGYSFGLEFGDGLGIAVLLRGSILDVVNGPELPAAPDPRILDWEKTLLSAVAFDASIPNATTAEGLFVGEISEMRPVDAIPDRPIPPISDWGVSAYVSAPLVVGYPHLLVSDYEGSGSWEPNPRWSVEAEFGQGIPEKFSTGRYSAFVNADHATGRIRGYGEYIGADIYTGPYLLGSLYDTLTFNLPPGMTSTTARFILDADAETSLSNIPTGDVVSANYLTAFSMYLSDGKIVGRPGSLKEAHTRLWPPDRVAGGSVFYSEQLVLEYEVVDGQQLQIDFVAQFDCYFTEPAGKCAVDFRNTATAGLELEPGVTFTSRSGMFLADTFGPTPEAEPYVFNGLFAPVDSAPTVNTVKAGRTVPIKWQLLDRSGYVLDPATFRSLTSQAVSCSSGTPSDAIEESMASGSSGRTVRQPD